MATHSSPRLSPCQSVPAETSWGGETPGGRTAEPAWVRVWFADTEVSCLLSPMAAHPWVSLFKSNGTGFVGS